MTFVDYSPDKHKDKQLYELQMIKLKKGVFTWTPVPAKVSHKEAAKTPWYYVVKEGEVKKAQDLEKLVQRQAEDDDPGPPLEDDDPFWEVDDAYQEELAARVEAGLKKSVAEEAEGD